MSEIIKLYLIRHARQESPLCNVNVPLADEGLLQSVLVGKRLKSYNIDEVYSSDLIRAKMTADIIRREVSETGLKEDIRCKREDDKSGNCDGGIVKTNIHEFHELREIDFGYLTGLSDAVIQVKYADYFLKRDDMREDINIPGGENGSQVYERMKKAINTIIERGKVCGHENIVIVSHGGAIRSYLAGILGMPQAKRFLIAKTMENTSVSQVNYDVGKDRFSVERINDYSHLEGYDNLLRKAFK